MFMLVLLIVAHLPLATLFNLSFRPCQPGAFACRLPLNAPQTSLLAPSLSSCRPARFLAATIRTPRAGLVPPASAAATARRASGSGGREHGRGECTGATRRRAGGSGDGPGERSGGDAECHDGKSGHAAGNFCFCLFLCLRALDGVSRELRGAGCVCFLFCMHVCLCVSTLVLIGACFDSQPTFSRFDTPAQLFAIRARVNVIRHLRFWCLPVVRVIGFSFDQEKNRQRVVGLSVLWV